MIRPWLMVSNQEVTEMSGNETLWENEVTRAIFVPSCLSARGLHKVNNLAEHQDPITTVFSQPRSLSRCFHSAQDPVMVLSLTTAPVTVFSLTTAHVVGTSQPSGKASKTMSQKENFLKTAPLYYHRDKDYQLQ